MTDSQISGSPQQQPAVGVVQQFWQTNPLCAFESPYEVGTKAFFDWHEQIRTVDIETFSINHYEFDKHAGERVLDVGCGIGWLCRHFALGGAHITGVDLTKKALDLTRKRLSYEGLHCELAEASAEELPFADNSFDFITSAGVLHHTPDTSQCVKEIHRVLRPGGRAMISLYYRNWMLSKPVWPITRLFINAIFRNVAGREAFKTIKSIDDFVRTWDGDNNPIGKSYTKKDVKELLSLFKIETLEPHYFPTRFLPLDHLIPRWLHRFLDHNCGTMIYANLQK